MKLLQRIVKNEAMKKDPPEIYGWRVLAFACIVSEFSLDQDFTIRTQS